MKITDDRSYINERAINNGWKTLDVYGIRIDRYFTEAEQAQNKVFADNLKEKYGETPAYYTAWSEHCEQIRKELSEKIYKLLCELEKHFVIYQFRAEDKQLYKSMTWDLFFWCNWKNNERDYSYVTLTLRNNKQNMTVDERMELTEKLRNFFEEYNETGIRAIIQYDDTENSEVVNNEAEKLFDRIKNKFVEIGYMTGKFKKLDGVDGYAFFKKRAKNHYYHYSPIDMLMAVSENC